MTAPPTTGACRRCGGTLHNEAYSAAHCTRECATIDADTRGPWRDRFHWRPMATAPRDGSSFVSLRVITRLGGWSRPIDSVPELTYVRRAPGAGYWRGVRGVHGHSIGDQQLENGWWTTLEEYSAAVAEAALWRSAPSHVPGFICCPLVFVRPPERRDPALTAEYGPVLEATVAWPHGNTGAEPERWSSAHTGSPGGHISTDYLNGTGWNGNSNPMRWMMLSEFFPEAYFRREIEQEKAAHAHRLAEWSRRATAPRPAVCAELDELWDGELPPDRAQAHREHLAWCDRCSKKLLGRMQEAAACLVK